MSETLPPPGGAGQRGPADHAIREQIISAADEHFRHYGYGKTTVADLAKAIGFSKAYIYKFFESKQAIGEAVSCNCVVKIAERARDKVASGRSATDKLRRMFGGLVDESFDLMFSERKLYDIVTFAVIENWSVTQDYYADIYGMLEQIILQGRESGEFERKTPLDETCRAILQAMKSFIHPLMLEHNLDRLNEASAEVVNLILRSLAP